MLGPAVFVWKNDRRARALEEPADRLRGLLGRGARRLEVRSRPSPTAAACITARALAEGQKTGWFYDQG